MHRKHYIFILISHLVLAISLLFPVITVSEIRLAPLLGTESQTHSLNLIEYTAKSINPVTSYLMIAFLIIAIAGISNAIFGIISKKLKPTSVKLSFIFGFSSAAMAAVQLYSGSRILITICVATFAVISVASIRLIKLEETQNTQ